MKTLTWVETVTWVKAEPALICGAKRGPRSRTRCELPPDHVVGRNFEPETLSYHTGRSWRGYWFCWPAPEFVDVP